MTPKQQDTIGNHGNRLLAIFPGAIERDPVKLCKRLRRLEAKGERIAVDYCNGAHDSEQHERLVDDLLSKVNATLGNEGETIPVFVNGDPRGYALKIRDEYVREHDLQIHRDWGGYGILAPEVSREGYIS